MTAPCTLGQMQDLAHARGGRCVSEAYNGVFTKLLWNCSKGHQWMTAPHNIKRGAWCPKCAGKAKHPIEDMRAIARSRGGACLSTAYIRAHTNLRWQCRFGHEWEATPTNVAKGRWCPECRTRISERICRALFEHVFRKPFPRAKPGWLLNSDGHRMELDGYCTELKIAFEYHGVQHFKDARMLHDRRGLKLTQLHDAQKMECCRNNGVALVEVPYSVPYREMLDYILQASNRLDLPIAETTLIEYTALDVYSPDILAEFQDIARARGGQCLSLRYVNSLTPLEFVCARGHRWKTLPPHARKHWCHKCSARVSAAAWRRDILVMRRIAQARGGECLSLAVSGSADELRWRCKQGHEWSEIAGKVVFGRWCPLCTGG